MAGCVRLFVASYVSLLAVAARLAVFHGHECERLHPVIDRELCVQATSTQPGHVAAESENHKHESCPVCQSYEAQPAVTIAGLFRYYLPTEFKSAIRPWLEDSFRSHLQSSYSARAPPS